MGQRASELLNRPVCFRDIRLGVVVDILLDEVIRRVLGLDVLCGDGSRRFLPLPACEIRPAELQVSSALVLMTEELGFYRRRGRSLASLRGFPVRRGGRELGVLRDLVFDQRGEVGTLLFQDEGGERQLPLESGLLLGPDALRPAV